MTDLILASNNTHKFREFSEILLHADTNLIMQKEAGFVQEVEETGNSFAENAFLKANAVTVYTGRPAIADDSGICVDALDGGPGIYSARFGSGIAANDEERMLLLLKTMEGKTDRHARYVCSICCTFPNGDLLRTECTCEGEVLHAPVGSGGFGYDPIFRPEGFTVSMAQLSPDEKNAISHRGKALREFLKIYERYMNDHK
ncbi:MAG: RdgB/HAM1 family non-canonical purine NTP pyrophosphatase [Oscillospiraceae bacterium]|nr:RdgB/HAM1 family non-canonical purine NTP pyrophosphatase [Oscillospiraceae bacterium]